MEWSRIVKTLLHVGCGVAPLPGWLLDHHETRVDVDPAVSPDIVADMRDLGDIGEYDVVYSCHCLEHLYPHDVNVALTEFLRVLKPEGFVVILVPDLEDIRPTDDVVYEVDAGPITGIDMFYGFQQFIKANPYMAHHTGFVKDRMESALQLAGFSRFQSRRMPGHNLLGIGVK